MRAMAIIPARYASSRFPGKPLAKIGGVEMIVRVCRQVAKTGVEVLVATDSEAIKNCVEQAGYRAVMTSEHHRTGTDRVREAYDKSGAEVDVIINVQGDEPFIDPSQIEALIACFEDSATDIATLSRRFDPARGFEALFDPNLVKLVTGLDGRALYFSRSIIPYVRNTDWQQWLKTTDFKMHVGVYAYRPSVLRAISELPQSELEKAESLEQLRWLENGYRIKVAETSTPTIGIDTPADLEEAEKYLKEIEKTAEVSKER
ncbi:MAG: 3-deoxy-manno-octulosonate cytidylyltransferase [Muribaculaceae bacterium]|nr:3-deoxy-manno-octulosonate cytidylyltransferase [Muribaculaceae bacterium]